MRRNVLITGTGGRSIGAGILHSLLRTSNEVRNRWRVIAADCDPFAWGLYAAEKGEVLPTAHSTDYVSKVNDLIERYELSAIIPGTQSEAHVLAENVRNLLPVQLVTNRLELLPLMTDKHLVASTLASFGLPYIETEKADNWEAIASKYGFPILFKPTLESGGSKGVTLAANEDEARFLLSLSSAGSHMCVQPYIGSGEREYTVGVLCDKKGKLIDSIVMHRRLVGLSLLASRTIEKRTCAISTGYSQGNIVKDSAIQDFCERLALQLKSVGPLNLQLRVLEDGHICVFEIHPRFSGTTPIRADVGFNEVDILLRNFVLDEEFGRVNYRTDVAAIRALEHVIVPLDKLKSPV